MIKMFSNQTSQLPRLGTTCELKRANSHGIVLCGSLRPYPDSPSWFGTGSEQGCVYCGEKDESRDHLFFSCPYTFTVWMNELRRHGGVCASVDMTTKVIRKLVKKPYLFIEVYG
ncbi:unnamed protein product [Brassica rapa]|uniref:Reverse transcriptase zinc-binding domain-containing protein n=1 Tax=Brassica campestris TaxID=3711 RepID=A0A3P6CMG7_BRACM|nr:unnamed protein product [Brassica rapa]VDD11261.1 unnamed protein product [Brassica rapa]